MLLGFGFGVLDFGFGFLDQGFEFERMQGLGFRIRF